MNNRQFLVIQQTKTRNSERDNPSMAVVHHLRRPPCTTGKGTGAPFSAESVHHEAGMSAPCPAECLHYQAGVRIISARTEQFGVADILRSENDVKSTIFYLFYYRAEKILIAVPCDNSSFNY